MAAPRSVYACDPERSRGRLFAEPPSKTRSPFRRDCDRVIHSTAFRRLKYKTQVFVFHEGDHYRTRLTHTLEVAQIARALARALGFDEDLAEALALAHDLGHPPFGHAGERQLDECLRSYGGFDHNAQALRVVTLIERRYGGHGIPSAIALYAEANGVSLANYPGPEAQIAAIADDIAYDAHDLDDGLRAELFGLEDLAAVAALEDILRDIDLRYPRLDTARRVHELIRRLIARMIDDVIAESTRRFAAAAPRSVDDVRRAVTPMIAFSGPLAEADRAIKRVLLPRMYRQAG